MAAPAGGLAIDGNLITGTPVPDVGDWIICTNVAPPGTAGAVLDKDGLPLDVSRTFHLIDPYNVNTDSTFSGGHKWFDDPNTWEWTASKASSKTDINNVLLHVGQDAEGHVWIAISADRFSTSGDSYIDFEFLQNRLTKNSNGTFTSAGPHGGHGGTVKGIRPYLALLRNRTLLFIILAQAFAVIFLVPLLHYGVGFFESKHGMAKDQATLTLGIIALVAGGLGNTLSGIVGDRLARRTKGAYALLAAGGFAAGLPFLLVGFTSDARVLFLPALTLGAFCYFLCMPAVNTQIANSTPPAQRG